MSNQRIKTKNKSGPLQGRELILKSALILLNKYGYGGLTISAVAHEAGIQRQLVYHHFKNTDDILLELAQRWDESGIEITLRALAELNEISAMKILGIAKGMFNWLRQEPDLCKLVLVLMQTSQFNSKLSKLMKNAVLAGRQRIHGFLLLEPQLKTRTEHELNQIIDSIHSHLYGFFFYTIIMNQLADIDEQEKACIDGLRSLIRSYF